MTSRSVFLVAAFALPALAQYSSKGPTAIGIVHTCLIPRDGGGARATGQLYTSNVIWGENVIWGDSRTLRPAGSCQGTSSWRWIERIATAPDVRVTPPQTPGVADVVDALRAAVSSPAAPVAPASFQRALAASRPIVDLPFVFPRGVFPQEQRMLAGGAGQTVNCSPGTLSLAARCLPATRFESEDYRDKIQEIRSR